MNLSSWRDPEQHRAAPPAKQIVGCLLCCSIHAGQPRKSKGGKMTYIELLQAQSQ